MVRPDWVRQSRRYLPSWRLGRVEAAFSGDSRSGVADALAEFADTARSVLYSIAMFAGSYVVTQASASGPVAHAYASLTLGSGVRDLP